MNQCIMPRKDVWSMGRAHRNMVFTPNSCSSQTEKVTNLRALVTDIEEQIAEVERLGRKMEWLATGELVAAVVMETSIGFLDLAASAFSSINPAASKAAKSGVLAIKSTDTLGQAATGQISKTQAAGQLADNAVNFGFSQVNPKGIAGQVVLNKAKMSYDASVLTIKSAVGVDEADLRKDATQFVQGQISENASLIADGLKEADLKTAGSTLKSLVIVGDMYMAAMRYQDSLDKRFNTRLAQAESSRSFVSNNMMTLNALLTRIRGQLKDAVAELEACQAA